MLNYVQRIAEMKRMSAPPPTSTSGQIVIPKFQISIVVSYSTTNFDGASAKIYACFGQKMAFVMLNFGIWRPLRGGCKLFRRNFWTPKGTSFADFTRFEPSFMQIRSWVFLAVRTKKRTLQKVTDWLDFTYWLVIPLKQQKSLFDP